MVLLPDGRHAAFISESGSPEPERLTPIDDTTRAADALRMIQAGEVLLWTGDFRNGRHLLDALSRRLTKGRREHSSGDLRSRWRSERAANRERGETLGGVVVLVEASGSLELRRAPETRAAVELAWGSTTEPRIVGLNTLIGALSAAEWTAKGLTVPGLIGKITPRFGVFSPTRRAYVDLLDHLVVEDRTVLDVGCGTGILGFVLLQHGARSAVGTDLETRAVRCATDNAESLGLGARYRAMEADLFPPPQHGQEPPEQRFDCVLFNAPWMPETPRTRLDRAVFDENGETLHRFLQTVSSSLTATGVAAVLMSDLPERLGLREPGHLERMVADAGFAVHETASAPATHKRAKDARDPLHSARTAERVQLLVFGRS